MGAETQTNAARGIVRCEKVLPTPPSTNGLFATIRTPHGGTRRIPTRAYNDWRALAGQLGKPWPRYSDDKRNHIPWTLHIVAWNLPRQRDLTNTIKAAEDLLVTHTGLRDSWMDHLVIHRAWDDGEPRMLIRIEITGVTT